MSDGQLQQLLEFLQRVGLLRRGADVDVNITLHQFPSLAGTATYHSTLLDALPNRRPVCIYSPPVVSSSQSSLANAAYFCSHCSGVTGAFSSLDTAVLLSFEFILLMFYVNKQTSVDFIVTHIIN